MNMQIILKDVQIMETINLAFLKYIQVLLQAENSITGGAYVRTWEKC